MSASVRQSELFAAEDWKVLYRAFTEINFNASDPPSIAAALRAYIQTNYPEDYNDWIESSEFVFIIELLAWLAGTLAFKTDINARENFLEVAEARESILRLARFLSYNPRRNQAASGLVKLIEISTDDDVIDSLGVNLNNTIVKWDDPDDPDWQERFTLILNNTFVQNNQFGQPLKTVLLSGVRTQQYRVNNRVSQMSPGFTVSTNGERMDFEICNGDVDESSGFYERTPSNDAAFHMYYRSDGNGNASASTGFFMLFKQGTMNKQTFIVPSPVENQVINVDVSGINDSDVWVQTVDDAGAITQLWEKVPAILGENTTFNSLPIDQRSIYQVVTRDDDKIALRFSDGRFADAPVGNIRVWYRTSNGQRYQIRPQDIDRLKISIPYTNRRGVQKTATFTFSLQESVSNSAPRETDDQIRRRAPTVYATQNRMVSGEDYNNFPLQSNVAVKMKAINRTYSGHSRFIDLDDPTGNYQDTNVFSDDGSFYVERNDTYNEFPVTLGRNPDEIISIYIQPILEKQNVIDYIGDFLFRNMKNVPSNTIWKRSTYSQYSSTGYFQNITNISQYIKEGAFLQFQTTTFPATTFWTSVADVQGLVSTAPVAGFRGPVNLNSNVLDSSVLLNIIPAYQATLSGDITADISSRLEDRYSFALWYNIESSSWVVDGYDPSDMDTNGSLVKIMNVDYLDAGIWRISTRGIRYVFESENNVRWYHSGNKAVDTATGHQKEDVVKVMPLNVDVNNTTGNLITGIGYRRGYDLAIDDLIEQPDGSTDFNRVVVKFVDSDEDGSPDDPDTFYKIVGHRTTTLNSVVALRPAMFSHLFWKLDASSNAFLPLYDTVNVFERDIERATNTTLPDGSVAYQIESSIAALRNTFWVKSSGVWYLSMGVYRHAIGRGSNVALRYFVEGQPNTFATIDEGKDKINFQWKHFAPTDYRIDPSKTNIIDIFVLTSEYDYLTRLWVSESGKIADLPLPPSELDLRIAFSQFDDYKMFSDEIIWRPVQYKFLFGEGAAEELKGQFKVIKLPTSSLSDGEIKSRIVRTIGDYFNVDMWDFGETFYFTELAGYVHQQLAGEIASFVFVPTKNDSSFGDGFEVRCRSDEIFLSTARVSDISIITSNTASNLRIK